MSEGMSKLEAVRLAVEALGHVPIEALAAHAEAVFGVSMSPTIVRTLVGSLQERQRLDAALERAKEAAERLAAQEVAKAPPPRVRKTKPAPPPVGTAAGLHEPKACPPCGGDYAFLGRKVVSDEQGGPDLVETKYRCKSCDQEWRVRVPAEAVGPLGVPKPPV